MNREKKGNRHDGEKAFRSGRGKLLALVALLTLSVGLAGGYLIAKETETSREKLPASKQATQGGIPQLTITQKEASASPAPQLEALYAQLNCMCGSCDRTLAACDDQTATTMKAEVAAAFRDHKSEKEIIDQMVKQYGANVLRTAGPSAQQTPAQNYTPSTAAATPIPIPTPAPTTSTPASAPELAGVYGELNCLCGTCNDTLAECSCTTAQAMKKEVAAALQVQKPEKEIVAEMVKRYGRKVLRASVPGKNAAEGLPAFAYNSAQALEAYRIAIQIPEVLEKMPCYCGCGKQSKHRYLKDCFLKDGGSGFDAHASGCNVCDNEAIDVKKWWDEKIPLKEIRAKIDEKYHKYGVPTPTPPIG